MNRTASGVTEDPRGLFPAARVCLEFGYLEGCGAVQSILGFAPR
jgi:hypothetical protein